MGMKVALDIDRVIDDARSGDYEHLVNVLMRNTVPESIQIGGIHVPKPLMEPPPLGTHYWFLDLHRKGLVDHFQWAGGDFDNRNLKRGLVHLIDRAALEHAKALIKVSGGRV